MIFTSDLGRAKNLSNKIVVNLTAHLTSVSFTSRQLVHMVAINLFALHHAKTALGTESSTSTEDGKTEVELSQDEQEAYDLVFNLMRKCWCLWFRYSLFNRTELLWHILTVVMLFLLV